MTDTPIDPPPPPKRSFRDYQHDCTTYLLDGLRRALASGRLQFDDKNFAVNVLQRRMFDGELTEREAWRVNKIRRYYGY